MNATCISELEDLIQLLKISLSSTSLSRHALDFFFVRVNELREQINIFNTTSQLNNNTPLSHLNSNNVSYFDNHSHQLNSYSQNGEKNDEIFFDSTRDNIQITTIDEDDLEDEFDNEKYDTNRLKKRKSSRDSKRPNKFVAEPATLKKRCQSE